MMQVNYTSNDETETDVDNNSGMSSSNLKKSEIFFLSIVV